MSEELILQKNGPYLRVVLPDFDPDRAGVWSAVDFELEDGVERAEVVAPCYPDDDSLAVVRELVMQLERCDVETVVEWQGAVPLENAGAVPGHSGPTAGCRGAPGRRSRVPVGPGQVLPNVGPNDP